MGKRVRKLTAESLKKMIQEEARKLQTETSDPVAAGVEKPEKVKAEETDADELAGSIEKDIDYIKALKIHESRLVEKLKKIAKAKELLGKRITERI
tara:strand:+ start:80 stop:367 length:288 start_codon:yes stop_codon:yes gene_type:complete